MSGAYSLSILRSASGLPQLKSFTMLPTGTIVKAEPTMDRLWHYSSREVLTLDDYARVLRELADDELAIIIRDDPKPGVDTTRPIYRRAIECVDVPRMWAMLDIDDLVAPHLDVVEEPELAAHFIRDELATYAPELEGVAMFIAWSGSCGIRDRSMPKAHVWLMLDRPLSGAELKRWARDMNARWRVAVNAKPNQRLIDDSIFDRVHIHFNARPSCSGFADPFPGDRRFVMLRGEAAASLVVPAFNAPRERRESAGDAPIGEARGFEARLARIGAGGVNAETMAAIGAVVRELGAERAESAKATILAKIEARIRETRDPERAAEHVAKLDGMFDRVVANQRAHDEEATRATPTYAPRGVPLDVAMARTAEAVDGFVRIARDRKTQLVADAQERKIAAKLAKASGGVSDAPSTLELPPPPVHAIRVDAGTGKTAAIVSRIARDRREGAAEHRLRVAYLVPLHRLGDQLVDDLRAAGVSAQLWRGVMADDPDAPGSKMCREPELAEAAMAINSLDAACQVCPSFGACGYQAQKAREPADVEVAAHNFAFASHAPARIKSADAVVVDEGFTSHATEGTGEDGDAPTRLLLSTLDAEPTGLHTIEAVDLAAIRSRVRRTLERAIEAGELRREMLAAEGLSLDDLNAAIRLEWRRKPDVTLEAGASVADLVARLKRLRAESTFTATLPAFLTELRRWMESDADVAGAIEPVRELKVGRAGSGPGVRFARRRDVAAWVQEKPLLLLDATMALPIVRELLPRVEVVADVEVLRPAWVRHHQLVEPLPVSALVASVDGAVRAKAKLRDVADRVELLARSAKGEGRDGCDVLVGATIDVEGLLRELLAERGLDVAPATGATRRHAIELAHFGAVEGSNAFGGVRHVVVVGWPLPPAGAMERQARALTGTVPRGEVGAGGYSMAPAGIALRDGTARGVEAPRHADDLVEAMRWAATEGRMVQLADRARGVRREATAPLDVWVLSALPLPGMPADRLLSWGDVAVDRLALAFWRLGGVLPLRPGDLVRTGLWETAKAAELALGAAGGRNYPSEPLENSSLKGGRGNSALYRRPGARGRWSSALFDPALPPARVVELLRAATGEPELLVELPGAAPAEVPATFTAPDKILAETPCERPPPPPRIVAATAIPARGVAIVATLGAAVLTATAVLGDRVDAIVIRGAREPGDELRAALAGWGLSPGPAADPPPARRSRFACRPCGLDGATLRAELRARGVTLTELARHAGISRPHLSNATAGRFGLSPDARERLDAALLALPARPPDLLAQMV